MPTDYLVFTSSLQTFKKPEYGTVITRSVTLFHTREETSPLRHTIDPLGLPRRTNVPAPHSAFIKDWFRENDHVRGRTSAAELFVFESAKSGKKLEVFVWTVEQATAVHYAFLLQVLGYFA